jgi:hypothetical protein
MSDHNEYPSRIKLPVPVSAETQLKFTREAVMRGQSPLDLAARCLEVIAKDDLFSAVIDT